jgi:hypothetical protein
MSTANSNVRWIEMYDQSGQIIARPDTTMPPQPAESNPTPSSTTDKAK